MRKLLEFLEETNGQFSSKRLFTFLTVCSAIIDWQHAIWTAPHIWYPTAQTVGLILGVVGFQVVGKFAENKESPDGRPKDDH